MTDNVTGYPPGLYAYRSAGHVASGEDDFLSLLWAAALRADHEQLARLERAFPGQIAELHVRQEHEYGMLAGECAPGIGCLGADGRIYLPCGCARDDVVRNVTFATDTSTVMVVHGGCIDFKTTPTGHRPDCVMTQEDGEPR